MMMASLLQFPQRNPMNKMASPRENRSFDGLNTKGMCRYFYSNINVVFDYFISGTCHMDETERLRKMLAIYMEIKGKKNVEKIFSVDEEYILCFLLEKCYLWKIEDNNLVKQVLISMYHKFGHFVELYQCFMWSVLMERREREGLNKWLPICPRNKEDEIDMICFFLRHATKSKLMFDDTRFIDLSVFSSCITPYCFSIMVVRPDLLLTLLRYGASVENYSYRTLNVSHALRHVLSTLLKNGIDKDAIYNLANGTKKILCIRYLLRAVSQLKYGCLNGITVGSEESPNKVTMKNAKEYVEYLSSRNLAPFLINRYLEPSELQHLCRCIIRKQLNYGWKLPYGIRLLPLHAALQDYVDLLAD